MRLPKLLLTLFLSSVASRLGASPNITSIANAASNIQFGPSGPIAQGAIFVIKGSGLGPSAIAISTTPFQDTTLNGTSVAVTVGTTTVQALMYYTSATQVAALLPSNTPTGSGTFQVTYNGQTSNQAGHSITSNNVGIFTVDSSGQGPGIVTYADYSLVSAFKSPNCGGPSTTCGSANPGDTLIIWATGLGPVSGSDASGAGLGQDMTNLLLTVWLGGVDVPVSYKGRSGCCIGEDQIVFTIPDTVPTGCAVPLVVQIGAEISNSTVLPVAKQGRNCTPNNAGLAEIGDPFAVLTGGPISIGDIGLNHNFNDNGVGFHDNASFVFARFTPKAGLEPFFQSYNDPPPPGTCFISNSLIPETDIGFNEAILLDGGSSITVKGPNGSVPVAYNSGASVTLSQNGSFLVPGDYTVNGTGGKDVGPFDAKITIPALPTLVSPTNSTPLSVTRSNGMTITWNGGDPNSNVQIEVSSATDATFKSNVAVGCIAPAGPGTFTIPAYAMLALPPTNFTFFNFRSAEIDVPFTAQGIFLGFLHTQSALFTGGGFALK